jgi:lipopolysaccharide/colanic/teichoic acid biosynthesis glycosyltransferase
MTTTRRVRLVPPPAVPAPHIVPLAAPPNALVSRSKRVLDVASALVLLVVSSPIWLFAGALILLSSPGPILFRQERVGAGGRTFTCLKLRTMHVGLGDAAHRAFVIGMMARNERSDGSARPYKLVDDPRVIPACRWLRKTSLDELPQLINVLRGEMSIVGPRPPLPYEVERYELWQHERLSVRPGITGLWQVSGRNRMTYNEMCARDIDYIRSWSLLSDLAIMAKTPWVMFIDDGGAA